MLLLFNFTVSGLQGEEIGIIFNLLQSIFIRKSTLNIHWKDWCWSRIANTLATWWEEPTHWKRSRYREILKAQGEGGSRGWDGWIASLTMKLSKLLEIVKDRRTCVLQFLGSPSQTGLSDWTKTKKIFINDHINSESSVHGDEGRILKGHWHHIKNETMSLKRVIFPWNSEYTLDLYIWLFWDGSYL